MSEVLLVKLRHTGVTLIAHVLEHNDKKVIVQDPYTIYFEYNPLMEYPMLYIYSWLPYSRDNIITLKADDVMLLSEPTETSREFYLNNLEKVRKKQEEMLLKGEQLEQLEEVKPNQASDAEPASDKVVKFQPKTDKNKLN